MWYLGNTWVRSRDAGLQQARWDEESKMKEQKEEEEKEANVKEEEELKGGGEGKGATLRIAAI